MSEHDKSMSNVCPVCQHDNSVDATSAPGVAIGSVCPPRWVVTPLASSR